VSAAALDHETGECTGAWHMHGAGHDRVICCTRCPVEHRATAENRLAAIGENYAGIYLRRQESAGREFLAGVPLGPARPA
jgi:hypothetical protein